VKSRQIGLTAFVALVVICCFGCAQQGTGTRLNADSTADQNSKVKANAVTPRVLTLRGVLRDHNGQRLAGVVGVLFALYEQQENGASLWQQVQNVQADNQGRFTTNLDWTADGLIHPELLRPGKELWLGRQVLLPGEVEQPRIRLVSAPNGLLVQRSGAAVLQANSGDQPPSAANQQPSEQPADTPSDESANRPPRSKLGLHRTRLAP